MGHVLEQEWLLPREHDELANEPCHPPKLFSPDYGPPEAIC